MPTSPIPTVIIGCAIIKYLDGKGAGDYFGGLPRGAEAEVRATPSYLGDVRAIRSWKG